MDGLTPSLVALGLVWYVAFLFSTTLHEAAHAWAALRMGDPTAYHSGQVTLNPLPHVRREPFGMVIVPILIFALSHWMVGWASAPYDPEWAERYPKRAALMALAGPAGNLLLVVASGIAIRTALTLGWIDLGPGTDLATLAFFPDPGGSEFSAAATFLAVLFLLNLILLVFNLLPLPPLDGSGALPLAMSDDVARRYRELLRHPAISLAGILLAWKIFSVIFGPLVLLADVLVLPAG